MNTEIATNSQLSTTESKKQTKQTSRTGTESDNVDHMEDYQLGGARGKMGKKVQGIRSTNW